MPYFPVPVGPCAFGRGLLAAQAFQPGQAILMFAGPLLDHAQVLELWDDQAYALQIGPDRYLDTMEPGRYLDFHHLPVIAQNRYLQLGIVQSFIVEEVRQRNPTPPPRRVRGARRVT